MASPASDPENRKERRIQKPELSIFLTVLPSPKSIGEVQVQVHREPAFVESTLAAHGVGKRRQWGVRPIFSQDWSPELASFIPSTWGCVRTSPPTPGPRHTILNKYVWPWSMWEFWRVTIVISRNAQTPAKNHFPDAWLF